ncbi:MAG: hypothetical protein RRA94_10630, partial [Bacteroidota bacterium]|nr:hypothetical protein [Bacteroidota bacterium]
RGQILEQLDTGNEFMHDGGIHGLAPWTGMTMVLASNCPLIRLPSGGGNAGDGMKHQRNVRKSGEI